MFKNYKKLYIEEREDKELCKKWKDYYAELVANNLNILEKAFK